MKISADLVIYTKEILDGKLHFFVPWVVPFVLEAKGKLLQITTIKYTLTILKSILALYDLLAFNVSAV